MKRSLSTPLLVSLVTALSAQASVITTDFGTSAPSLNVEAGWTSGNASYQWRDNETSERDLGQSFLAESNFTMDSFSFQTDGNIQVGASGSAFTATIYESTEITSIGTQVSAQTGNYVTSAINPVAGNWLLFDLEENISITSGNYYTIMLSWNVADVTDQDQVFRIDTNNTYTDGSLWEYDGSSYTRLGYDMAFTVQSIPEPAMMAQIMGLGILSLAFVVKRRRKA